MKLTQYAAKGGLADRNLRRMIFGQQIIFISDLPILLNIAVVNLWTSPLNLFDSNQL